MKLRSLVQVVPYALQQLFLDIIRHSSCGREWYIVYIYQPGVNIRDMIFRTQLMIIIINFSACKSDIYIIVQMNYIHTCTVEPRQYKHI